MNNFAKLAYLAVLIVAGAVYYPSLNGGFLFDDFANIVDNKHVHLATFSIAGLIDSLGGLSAGPLGRPVSVGSFALTHLFFGLDPFAFKAINLVIHLFNGLLIGCFVSLLFKTLPEGKITPGIQRWLPLWVAAVWVLHPIHFVAINMAVQRMTLLAAMFTLLGLIAYLKAADARTSKASRFIWAAGAWAVCWPLAVFSKETGLLFPVFAALITWSAAPQAGGTFGRRRNLAWATAAMVLVALLMYWRMGWSWLDSGYAVRDFSLTERLLTEARVLWFYLGQIVLPSPASFALYLDWIPLSRGVLDPPSTLAALVAWVVLLALAAYYRQRHPIAVLGLAWFLAGHSIESSFIPLELAHEHRNYLPALGPLLAVGYYVACLFEDLKADYKKLIPTTAALSAVVLLAILTTLRSMQVADPLIGTQIEATRHETSARANYVAGWALIKAGRGDKGDPFGGINVRFYFEQAERSDKGFKLGYLGLITWACASGREVEREWLEEFANRLQATTFSHGQLTLPGYLLRPLVSMPKCLPRQDVLELFEAGSRNPRIANHARARFLEAAADYELTVSRDAASAQEYYRRSSALDPANIGSRTKLESSMPRK
jgi:hypothetical protein